MTEYICPECSRPIATRRHKNCTYCGCVIPEELLFSPEEKKRVKAENESLHKKHHEIIKKDLEFERYLRTKTEYGSDDFS